VRPLAPLFALLIASSASAADWEGSVWLGPAFPFYKQKFEYDPGPLSLGIPGTSLVQRGNFALDARGGIVLGAAAAVNLTPAFGLELRLDTADVRVKTQGARYALTARGLPPPLPAQFTRDVDLGTGDVDVERVRPVSLNLRFRSRGPVRVSGSAGASWLPRFRLVAHQAVGLGLPGFNGTVPIPDLAHVELAAEALPSDRGEGRFGFNAGAGVQRVLNPRVSLAVEGRYFWFQRQTLYWGRARSDTPLPPLEDALVSQIEGGLQPAKFNPTFFQATAGVTVGF
jgi:opacity protein-like surface antigen